MIFYKDFPPEPYFNCVLKSHPKSAWLYKMLWERKNRDNKIVVDKDTIRAAFFVSPTIFRNHLLPLLENGLATVQESTEKLVIEMTDFDEDGEDQIFF